MPAFASAVQSLEKKISAPPFCLLAMTWSTLIRLRPVFPWDLPVITVRVARGGPSHRDPSRAMAWNQRPRSEEHTSELQSPDHLVCRLLLEKKKKKKYKRRATTSRCHASSNSS